MNPAGDTTSCIRSSMEWRTTCFYLRAKVRLLNPRKSLTLRCLTHRGIQFAFLMEICCEFVGDVDGRLVKATLAGSDTGIWHTITNC